MFLCGDCLTNDSPRTLTSDHSLKEAFTGCVLKPLKQNLFNSPSTSHVRDEVCVYVWITEVGCKAEAKDEPAQHTRQPPSRNTLGEGKHLA